MLLQLTKRIEIPVEYKEKIDTLNSKELIDAWKRSYEKAKRLNKSSEDFVKYSNIANFIFTKYETERLAKEQEKIRS